MTTMHPENLVVIDFSGTLSLAAPRFGRPENLVRALKESGLASLGIATPEFFWEKIVNPTWTRGSTTPIGYAGVMAEQIASLCLGPDTPRSEIETAASCFVAAYLDASKIDPRWRTLLARLADDREAVTIIATDHYAETTGNILSHLSSWKISAGDTVKGAAVPSTSHTGLYVANSADLGVWKADRRFWEILKSRLPLTSVRRILVIEDFGFNEEAGDDYGTRAAVFARKEKTLTQLREAFQAEVKIVPFFLAEEGQGEADAGPLIAETILRIEEFLSGGQDERQ